MKALEEVTCYIHVQLWSVWRRYLWDLETKQIFHPWATVSNLWSRLLLSVVGLLNAWVMRTFLINSKDIEGRSWLLSLSLSPVLLIRSLVSLTWLHYALSQEGRLVVMHCAFLRWFVGVWFLGCQCLSLVEVRLRTSHHVDSRCVEVLNLVGCAFLLLLCLHLVSLLCGTCLFGRCNSLTCSVLIWKVLLL